MIFIGILCLVYGLYAGYFYYAQRSLIFPRHLVAPPLYTIADFPGWQQQWFDAPGVRVESWFSPPGVAQSNTAAPLFIIAHGNGELMDLWPTRVTELQERGYGVLLVEYPGYGRSAGEPSEEAIAATFAAAYDWAITQPDINPEQVILFGFSVGGGAISTLAKQRPSAALILMSTFTRIADQAARFYLPGFLTRDTFDNLALVSGYANPIFLIHGLRDTTIPHTNSIALNASASQSKLLLLPCGHADCISDWTEFWWIVEEFLMEQRVLTKIEREN